MDEDPGADPAVDNQENEQENANNNLNGGEAPPDIPEVQGDPPQQHKNFSVLDSCSKHLDGETLLPKPRVSRESIILVLKEHNAILSALRADLGGLTVFVEKISKDVEETKADVAAIQADTAQQRQDIDKATERIDGMEDVTSALTEKLAQVDQMASTIESHGQHLSKLQEQTDNEAQQNAAFQHEADMRINAVGARAKDLEAGAKAMESRMDSMKDEIQIGSDQVVYKRKLEVGEAEADTDLELTLTDVLHDARDKVASHGELLEVQRTVLRNHGDELERKAKIEVEDMADRHEKHLARIQKKMDADADVDLTDIRRNQENIATTLEAVQVEMLEKTDKAEVDSKIEHKYMEILDHLQTALNATEEDEDDFKNATETLNNAVDELRKEKADKRDMTAMKTSLQEQLAKVAAQAAKAAVSGGDGAGGMGGMGGMVGVNAEALEERPTREELAMLLEDKLDEEVYRRAQAALDGRVGGLETHLLSAMRDLQTRVGVLTNHSGVGDAVAAAAAAASSSSSSSSSVVPNHLQVNFAAPMPGAPSTTSFAANPSPGFETMSGGNSTAASSEMQPEVAAEAIMGKVVESHAIGGGGGESPSIAASEGFGGLDATSAVPQLSQIISGADSPSSSAMRSVGGGGGGGATPMTTTTTAAATIKMPSSITTAAVNTSHVADMAEVKRHVAQLKEAVTHLQYVAMQPAHGGAATSAGGISALAGSIGMSNAAAMGGGGGGGGIGGIGGIGGGMDFPASSRPLTAPGSPANPVKCLSCEQPIVNAGRMKHGGGQKLGGGFTLRSPTPEEVNAQAARQQQLVMAAQLQQQQQQQQQQLQQGGGGGSGRNAAEAGKAPMRPGANSSLPGIDREAYFRQQRAAANEMMGVMGIDGKLYRSDVAKPSKSRIGDSMRGDSSSSMRSSNNQRDAPFPPAR